VEAELSDGSEYPSTRSHLSATFQPLSVALPTLDETTSLTHTIDCLVRDLRPDLAQILIIVCDRSTPETLKRAEAAAEQYPDLVGIHWQDLPYFGGAVRKAVELTTGSHTLLMGSDLETTPEDAPALVAAAKENPTAVITASRWRGGGCEGYNPVKLGANWIFQRIFALLYWTKLSDMTFGYRILPTHLTREIQWEELRHPFVLETIVKPLQLGVRVVEVPTSWTARVEGESVNSFMRNFEYFRPGLRVRFMSRDAILGKRD